MTISVIIPNHCGKVHLKSCLESLNRSKTENFHLETIVVDNGSTDGSTSFIKNNFPNVKVIELDKNYGFAKAINEGIRASKGTFVALLNNDVKVSKNWLSELVKAARFNPKISIFASNIVSWDGKKIDSQGIRFFQIGKAEQINQGKKYQSPRQRRQSPITVFGACAAAALYKKNIFEEIGYFDEDFFAYLEDVDFSFRAQLAGFKNLFVPTAVAYHKGLSTSRKMGNFKTRMDTKNWFFLIIKNYPSRYLFQTFLERLKNLSGLLKSTKLFFWFPTLILVYGEVLIKLPKKLIERQQVQKSRRVSDGYLEKILTA